MFFARVRGGVAAARLAVPPVRFADTTGMELPLNPFKRAIKDGRVQIGLWSCLASNISIEALAGAGGAPEPIGPGGP